MATVDLTLFFTFPHTAYHACIALILAKLYSNSFLVILNSRIKIVGSRNRTQDHSYVSYRGGNARAGGTNSAVNPVVLSPRTAAQALGGIRIEEETWVTTDGIQLEDQVSVPHHPQRAHFNVMFQQKPDLRDRKPPSL